MKKIGLIVCALMLSFWVSAQQSSQWIRYASISPDGQKIAFAFKGDVYVVSATGGEAKAITYHEAHDFMPVWSNDGSKIAFASDRNGNFDVFVVSANGGQPTRLTYHSAAEYPYTFSADDKNVVFGGHRMDDVNHRQYPTGSQPEVYTVSVNGGSVNQLWTIPAEDIKISKDGNTYIYHDKKGGEDTFRKHHTSAITRDIWVYNKANDTHTMISSFNGEDRSPVFSTDEKSIYYLSEEGGSFNVFTMKLENPSQKSQITNFTTDPVRYLSIANNGTLCFTQNGDLYTMAANQEPVKINVTVTTGDKSNDKLVMSISGEISEMAVSPDGKEVAYIVRGEVFASSVEGSFTKRITNTPGQERFVSFSTDGKSIMYAAERNGKWGVYKTEKTRKEEPYFYASTLLKEEAVIVNDNDNYQPKMSPDGKEIAFIENKRDLKILNIKSKETRTLLTGKELVYMRDGDQYFNWSPDSKWILAEYSPVMANTEAVLLDAQGKKPMVNLTESGYGDYSPVFAADGKQIVWFSDRNGLRSHANSGSRQLDVYTMFLTQDAWDKHNMSKDEYALMKELKKKNEKKEDKKDDDKKSKKKKKEDKAEKKDSTIKIEWDGLRDRKDRLTIHSSSMSDALLSKDGETLYYLTRFEKRINLWTTKVRTGETKLALKLGARSASMVWDKAQENIFLLSNGSISKIAAKGLDKESVSTSGTMVVDLAAERLNMFEHVWKKTKSMFYEHTFHGIDWDRMGDNYRAKLPSINNDFDFTELLSEMLGELNVSHCGARYRGGNSDGDRTASLGIFYDFNYKGNGIKITEVIKGGPLDKNSLNVKAGMIIEQINGVNITNDTDFAMYLNRISGKFTSLTVLDPATKKSQIITVKPISLGAENGLLYERWVRANEDEVERLSNGKLGYIHLPGMNDGRYRNAYENVMGRYHDREGIIVDTRFNGGGDLVADLAMFFTGEKFLTYAVETRAVGYEPGYRWTKPTVAMANESNYSDGSCFACAYTELNIGKLVGMPVPGTCSFAGWEMLQNGTVLWGSVPVSAKNSKGEWMENNQTEPDVKVKNMPGKIDKGIDQQLETAVLELQKLVK